MKKLLLIIINFTIYCNYALAKHCSGFSPEYREDLCNPHRLRDEAAFAPIIFIVFIFSLLFLVNKFRTPEERKKQKKAKEKELLKEEKKRIKEEKLVETDNEVGDSLTSKVSRLKRLYNNGTLTKAEFEQAKNKLLK